MHRWKGVGVQTARATQFAARTHREADEPRGNTIMRKMCGVWECFTRSRMATLAVNALLLSAGPPACRTVAAVSAGAGWSDPGASVWRSVASLRPHNPTRHAASTTAAAPKGALFGRHRDDAQGDGACKSKRSTGEEPRRRAKRGEGAAGHTATDRNMYHSSRRRWFGWVQGEQQQAKEPQEGPVWRNVLGIKAAVAAAAAAAEGGAATGTREAARGGTNRFRRASTASCDEPVQRRQQQQQQQHRRQEEEDSVYSRAAAIVNTAMRMPSAASSAAGVTAAGAAVSAAAAASPAPVPSYLQWRPSNVKDAAEPESSGAGGDLREKRSSTKKELSLGVGSRAGRSGSSSEATTTGSDEGSLGAAKSSRGGGGAGAVSLSFREAMFAGAVSRSIAQARRLHVVVRCL